MQGHHVSVHKKHLYKVMICLIGLFTTSKANEVGQCKLFVFCMLRKSQVETFSCNFYVKNLSLPFTEHKKLTFRN